MFGKPLTKAFQLPQLPSRQPIALTLSETKRISGGGSNVLHGNPGGDTPIGNPGYGPPGGNPADPNPVGPRDE